MKRHPLIWLSGAQPALLEQAPGDRAKYQGIGGAVLTTATLAGVSMFFALEMALRAPWYAALPISLVWFLAILNLDRWLVVSIQRGNRAWLVALPRLLMALLFGFIISTPLVLRIFQPEIETEINKIRQEQTERFQGNLDDGEVGRKIDALEKQEAALLQTIAGGGTVVNPEEDPQIVALRERLAPLEKTRDENADAATCELTGDKCRDGSRKSGAGPRYENFRAKQREAERQIREINQQIQDRRDDITATSKTSREQTLREANETLPGVQTQLENLRQIQSDEQMAFEQANEGNTGLLVRLDALNRASAGDFTLGLWRILLFLLFTVIECLPIFVKILQLYGPPNTYEQLAEEHAKRSVTTGKLRAETHEQALELQQTSQLSQSRALVEAREEASRKLGAMTAESELRVAAAILAAWEEREIARIPKNLDEYVTSTHDPIPEPGSPEPAVTPPLFGPNAPGVMPYYAPAFDEEARRADVEGRQPR
ncbi:DUF4407 domain-containing protein [Actinocorallia populi]|uniref:DUF4407 domain-containing protein n=1 Tax=Actinocorallia populi TaxID=2079200 RepID=UPI0013008240|nr:DUF4407 domain-containing protein [Actinocorallia populi]